MLFFCTLSLQTFAQKSPSLADCKKWFKIAIKDFNKNPSNFSTIHCRIPFLHGSGGDAYYSYNTINNEGILIENINDIFGCFKKISQKKISIKEFIANEESLSFLSNSYEYNERDENGNKVNPNAKPPYDGLISYGEKVFSISYNCGTKHPSYNTAPLYELYVIFDKKTQSFRFWAATSGF
jgi:hypothetical protein